RLEVRVRRQKADGGLKPEMFGTIHLKSGTREALLVPAAAIIREGNTTTVFVRNGGKAEQRQVTVGATIDGNVVVVSGLLVGEEVATDGAELLKGSPGE